MDLDLYSQLYMQNSGKRNHTGNSMHFILRQNDSETSYGQRVYIPIDGVGPYENMKDLT